MRTHPQAGWAGALPGRRPLIRLPRPAGIRNGGLLLVLVALAAVMTLVDRPPTPADGPRLPGVFQHLAPPVGITATPPVVDLPAPAGGGSAAAGLGAGVGERPAASGRAHPGRTHPRPSARAGFSSMVAGGGGASRPVGGGGGQGGSGASSPPVTTPPVAAAPAVTVRVPPVQVRDRTPSVLGRDLPDVQAATPAATVATPAVRLPRLG